MDGNVPELIVLYASGFGRQTDDPADCIATNILLAKLYHLSNPSTRVSAEPRYPAFCCSGLGVLLHGAANFRCRFQNSSDLTLDEVRLTQSRLLPTIGSYARSRIDRHQLLLLHGPVEYIFDGRQISVVDGLV